MRFDDVLHLWREKQEAALGGNVGDDHAADRDQRIQDDLGGFIQPHQDTRVIRAHAIVHDAANHGSNVPELKTAL